jgi:hypothetical protein
MRIALALVAPALVMGLASAAWADNDKDKGKHGKGGHDRGGPPVVIIQPVPAQPIIVQPLRVIIPQSDRAVVYQYYRTEYSAGRCPPGLAKKGNGCWPPGQVAKAPPRVWVVGQPLPPAVVYEPVPPVVVQRLEPVPDGYGYVRVDNDVLLMDMANRVVADVIGDLYDPYDLD